MKKIKLLFFLFIMLTIGMAWQYAVQSVHNSSGAIPGVANDPASNFQNCSSCHSGAAVSPVSNWITTNIPNGGYTPGQKYTITATATNPNLSKFGFEIAAQNTQGQDVGTLTAPNNATQLTFSTKNTYITHTNTSTMGVGSKTWTFEWTAPAKGSGAVTFYGSFLGANDNKNDNGDLVYISSTTVQESTQTTATQAAVQNMEVKVYPNPTSDFVSLEYTLPQRSEVEIKLLNSLGVERMLLQDKKMLDGTQQVSFELNNHLDAGVYFIALYIDGVIKTEKIIIK
jgi:hypothetical protein